ncbi:MAG TPA: hypothetical protein VFK47_00870, partial [Ktedonobacteraceae bacterium]|nr:hypothetical protein [Ktedonobacteraceae bacterium]
AKKVAAARLRHYTRDMRMNQVRAVRASELDRVAPGLLADDFPKPIVSNVINVAAQYSSEQIGVMPTVSCTTGVMVSDRQKKYAQRRTLIAHNYLENSRVKVNMVEAADWLNTYSFLPIILEPHFGDAYCDPGPRLRFENPLGCYYDLDIFGHTRWFAKVYDSDVDSLCAKFPHLAVALRAGMHAESNQKLEMVVYFDDDQITTFVPSRDNLQLLRLDNKFGRCPVFIAEAPKFDDESRGAYDDVIWIQVARAIFAQYGMAAAKKSINAPLVVGPDVVNIPFGRDRVIRSTDPNGIKYVATEMSPAAWQQGELLNQDITVGARFPEGATGKSPGSIVTGRGMEELMGTIDSKVRTYQLIMGDALRRTIGAAFEMDEKFWPNKRRFIRVQVNGQQFEETYVPSRDIAGVYQVDVTYGMAAGMDPNRALVFLLQARGDKLISRDFALRQLPFDINVDQVMEQIDTEELTDALKQMLAQTAMAVPMMASQGMDPTDTLTKLAKVMDEREKGVPVHKAILTAFAPQQPPQAPAAPQQAPPGMPGQPMPPGAPQGPPGQPQGQQQPVDIQRLLAGLSGGGAPNLQANVMRKLPIQ